VGDFDTVSDTTEMVDGVTGGDVAVVVEIDLDVEEAASAGGIAIRVELGGGDGARRV
jgi:hypothetical protein